MYNSLSLPVKDESDASALDNSHRESFEDTLSRHKVKAAIAIVFIVVVALVGLANNPTQATGSQQSKMAYVEGLADSNIEEGDKQLDEVAIRSVVTQLYLTHSPDAWDWGTNKGVIGSTTMTTDEQWNIHYFTTGGYFKIVHSHADEHWLTMNANNFPTVTPAGKAIYDTEDFIRWYIVMNADGSEPLTDLPPTDTDAYCYLVNKGRDPKRCLAIETAVDVHSVLSSVAEKSVVSYPKDASGNFPDACKIQFLDASNAPPARKFW